MPSQTDQKTYTVTRQFTDTSGQEWREGDNFTGDEKAIQNALRNGNIKEGQAGQPSQQQSQSGQGQQGQGQAGQSQPKRTS